MSAPASPSPPPTGRLPLGIKVAYGLPSIAGAAMAIPIAIHMTKFYADNIGLALGYIALAQALARAFDAITDPLMGWITDRTHTRWGRRRPWMLLGAPLCAVAFMALFAPPEGIRGSEAAAWFTGTFVLYFLFHTVYIIPHYGLGPELTLDYHERSSLFAWRDGTTLLGTMLAGALPGIAITALEEGGTPTAQAERIVYADFAVVMGILLAVLYLWLCVRVKEHPYFYEYLTVLETLTLFANLYGIERRAQRARIDTVIDRVGLGHKRRAALRSLSKGTLQRVGIAQAILNEPRLLVLDEPMSGLDPIGRRQMRELIRDIRDQGTSIIFSSHILPDAEALCDRVGILTQGELKKTITLADHSGADHFEVKFANPSESLRAALAGLSGVSISLNGTRGTANIPNQQMVDQLVDILRQHGASVESLQPRHTSLEEEFVQHAGSATRID